MKKFIAALLILVPISFANAQYPEMNGNLDAEQVFEMSSQSTIQRFGCYKPTTEWTCFARDSRGNALGISSSFTNRQLAAGRAVESCRRKSTIPSTCAITRCQQPQVECDDDDGDN